MHLRKTLNYDFGESWTPVLSCSFMTENHWATQSALTGIWTPGLFCSFIRDKPVRYWIYGLTSFVRLWSIYHWDTQLTVTEWSSRTYHRIYPSRIHIYIFAVEHHHTKSMSISIQIPNPSRVRHLDTNQVNPDPWTEIKSSSIPHTEIKSISTTQSEQFQYRCSPKNQAICGPHPRPSQFRSPPTQEPSQSIITLKTSLFRPALFSTYVVLLAISDILSSHSSELLSAFFCHFSYCFLYFPGLASEVGGTPRLRNVSLK